LTIFYLHHRVQSFNILSYLWGW